MEDGACSPGRQRGPRCTQTVSGVALRSGGCGLDSAGPRRAAFHAPGHGPRLEDPRRRDLGSRSGHHRVRVRPSQGAGLDLEDILRQSRRLPFASPDCQKVSKTQPLTGGRDELRRPFRVVKGESTLVEVANLLNDPVIRRHRVVVDGLEPDTVYRYSLGDGTLRRMGTVANRQDGTGLLSRGAVPLPGRRPDGTRGLGPAAQGGLSPASRHRFHPARRRPGRSRKRADQLGPFLLAGRRGLRSRAPHALRGKPRIPRHGPAPLSCFLRAAPQWAPRDRSRPGLPLRVWRRLRRGARQHARRLRPRPGATPGGVARRDASKQQGLVEIRDVSSPRLSVASLARHAGLARALGADLRQAPRRPRPARTRSRLSEDVPHARTIAGSTGQARERFT